MITLNVVANNPKALVIDALAPIQAQPDDKLRNAAPTPKTANNLLILLEISAIQIETQAVDTITLIHKATAPTNREDEETLRLHKTHRIMVNLDRSKRHADMKAMKMMVNNLNMAKDGSKATSNANSEDNTIKLLNNTILALKTAVAHMVSPLDNKTMMKMTMKATKLMETTTKVHGKEIIEETPTTASLPTLLHDLPTHAIIRDLHIPLMIEMATGNLEATVKVTLSATPLVVTTNPKMPHTAHLKVPTTAMATINGHLAHQMLPLTTLPTLVAPATNQAIRAPNVENPKVNLKPSFMTVFIATVELGSRVEMDRYFVLIRDDAACDRSDLVNNCTKTMPTTVTTSKCKSTTSIWAKRSPTIQPMILASLVPLLAHLPLEATPHHLCMLPTTRKTLQFLKSS